MDERKEIANRRQLKRRAEHASSSLRFPGDWAEILTDGVEYPTSKRPRGEISCETYNFTFLNNIF
jgi:hypothetical protein